MKESLRERYRFAGYTERVGRSVVAADSQSWATFLGMGAAVAAQLAVGLALGWLVDSLAGTKPVFLIVGLFVGVVGAIYYAIVQFRSLMKD